MHRIKEPTLERPTESKIAFEKASNFLRTVLVSADTVLFVVFQRTSRLPSRAWIMGPYAVV
jgi:hypothetical protein